MAITNGEDEPRTTACPRCGGEASWTPVTLQKGRIAILCSDCGRFEMAEIDLEREGEVSTVWPEPEEYA